MSIPKHNLNEAKIEEIKRRLENKERLEDIAPKVGYSDHASLSRALKSAGLRIGKTLLPLS